MPCLQKMHHGAQTNMEEQGSHPGITNENKQFEHDAERAWCDMQTILEDQLPEKTVEQPESDMLMMHCLHAMCIDSNPQQGEIQPFDAGDDVAEAINELEPVCIESGRKLFLCPYKDCDKTFERRYNLKVHTRRHTGEMPYKCPRSDTCENMVFRWRSSLRHHMKSVHKEVVPMSQTITRRKKSGRTSKRKNALRKRIEESHIENETSNEASQASTQDETCLGAWGSPLSDETKQGCDQNCAQPCVEDAVSLKQADVLEFDPFCLPDGIELNDCGSNVLLGDCVDGILSAKEGELCVSDLSWSI